MDRGKNPFDGSRRRLSSIAHKSAKDYNRILQKNIEDKLIEEFGEKICAESLHGAPIPQDIQDYIDKQEDTLHLTPLYEFLRGDSKLIPSDTVVRWRAYNPNFITDEEE